MRALDYCTMLHLDKSLEMAYQLASRHHMIQLAERIDLIRKDKAGNGSDPFAAYRQATVTTYQPVPRQEEILPRDLVETSFSRKLQYIDQKFLMLTILGRHGGQMYKFISIWTRLKFFMLQLKILPSLSLTKYLKL